MIDMPALPGCEVRQPLQQKLMSLVPMGQEQPQKQAFSQQQLQALSGQVQDHMHSSVQQQFQQQSQLLQGPLHMYTDNHAGTHVKRARISTEQQQLQDASDTFPVQQEAIDYSMSSPPQSIPVQQPPLTQLTRDPAAVSVSPFISPPTLSTREPATVNVLPFMTSRGQQPFDQHSLSSLIQQQPHSSSTTQVHSSDTSTVDEPQPGPHIPDD